MKYKCWSSCLPSNMPSTPPALNEQIAHFQGPRFHRSLSASGVHQPCNPTLYILEGFPGHGHEERVRVPKLKQINGCISEPTEQRRCLQPPRPVLPDLCGSQGGPQGTLIFQANRKHCGICSLVINMVTIPSCTSGPCSPINTICSFILSAAD